MIKLSDKKADIKEQLKTEELNINVLIVFQEKLNNSVINYSKKIIQESFTDINSEKLNEVSDSFLDISKALKKSESIIETCNQLKDVFETFRDDIDGASSSAQKLKIEEYNKKFTTLNKKINTETNELQTFISNYEKNEILKQFLEKENETPVDIDIDEVSNTIDTETSIDTSIEIKDEAEVKEETPSPTEQFSSILEEYSKEETSSEEDNSVSKDTNESKTEPETETEIEVDIPTEDIKFEEKLLEDIDTIEDGEGFDDEEPEVSDDNKEDPNNYIQNIYEENLKKSDFTVLPDEDSNATHNPDDDYSFAEKTLLISERENVVTLPYTVEELKEKRDSNPEKYKSLQDVIAQDYTLPLNYYRSSAISRFREAYRLVRNKDHGSIKHALDLATELFFKSSLHPAIITACKNSDELDVYLSCLEFDELEDFKIFNIIFEILPKAFKKRIKASN